MSDSTNQVLVQGLALLLMISGVYSSNSLTSFPSQINETVIAHVGDEISLTCSHSNVISAITQWIISSPVNCSVNVNHNNPQNRQCGPFMFQNITPAVQDVTELNSTAVAVASTETSGSVVECKAGIFMAISVGNISLCVIDGLPEPVNLSCTEVSNGLSVTWDVVTSDCAMSFITHNVTVVREHDETVIASMNDVKDNWIIVGTDSLELNQNYSIVVSANIVHGLACCETSEAAVIVCTTSDDLSPSTTTTATTASGTNPATEESSSLLAAAVAIPIIFIVIIAIIIIVVLVVIAILYYHGYRYNKKSGKLVKKTQNSKSSSKHTQYVDPGTLTHTQAPDGALYTDIDKVEKNKLLPKYQEDTRDLEIKNSVYESKDQDVNGAMTVDATTIDAEAKEDDRPPKPIRISKAKDYPIISEESSSKHSQYVDPDTLTHTQAPGGALYTVIDRVDKKNLPAKSQKSEDPSDSEKKYVDESKDQDVNGATTIDAEAKEDDRPPKPIRISKAKDFPMYEDI